MKEEEFSVVPDQSLWFRMIRRGRFHGCGKILRSKNRPYRSPDISVTKLIAIVVGLIPTIRMCLMTQCSPNKKQYQEIWYYRKY